MNYYQEITLLPDPEISLYFIWTNLFQQVHIALVDNKVADNQSMIAVGFPEYGKARFPLGNKLRLFAKEKHQLESLDINKWLERLQDYVHIKGVKAVPGEVGYVSFSRKHIKTPQRIELEMENKAERWSKKSGKALVDCLAELEKTKPRPKSPYPFIFLHSQKTKQRSPKSSSKFPLFIQMQALDTRQAGVFDCYGLSAKVNKDDNPGCVPQF